MSTPTTWTDEALARDLAADAVPAQRAALLAASATDPALAARVQAQLTVDRLLPSLPRPTPSPAGLLRVRQALTEAMHPAGDSEIMTLPEVAAFLRLPESELGGILEELPAFELAGQLRIRRTRLLEWIAQREQGYRRAHVQHWLTSDPPPRHSAIA
jgi:hypothetical protein